jgi:hypothetical protein
MSGQANLTSKVPWARGDSETLGCSFRAHNPALEDIERVVLHARILVLIEADVAEHDGRIIFARAADVPVRHVYCLLKTRTVFQLLILRKDLDSAGKTRLHAAVEDLGW